MHKVVLLLLLGFGFTSAQSEWWVYTSKGRFKIQTREDKRPNTARQFSEWVRQGIYTKTSWRSMLKDSSVQSAALEADAFTKTDPDTTLKFDQPGVLAFTKNAAGNFTGSFKIQIIASPKMNRSQPIFGHVVKGIQVVYALNQVPVNAQGLPITPVFIDSIKPEDPKNPLPIPTSLDPSKVRFYTRYGSFTLLVHDDMLPVTSSNFLKLIKSKYYDGNPWNRIVSNFVNQTGPRPGQNEPSALPEDYHPLLRHDGMTVSMATAGPGTGTSHFAIQVIATPHLNDHYSLFAHIIEGSDVVLKINQLPTDKNEVPLVPILTDSARLLPTPITGIELNRPLFNQSLLIPHLSKNRTLLEISGSWPQGRVPAKIMLMEMTGRSIPLRPIGRGLNKVSFSISAVPSGIYFYRAQFGDQVLSGKWFF